MWGLLFSLGITQSLCAQSLDIRWGLFVGMGTTTDSGGNTATLGHYGSNLLIGIELFDILTIGNTIETRIVDQLSEADEEKDNFRGTYLSYYSPTIGLNAMLRILIEYKLDGQYQFFNENEQGSRIELRKPTGFRVEAGYPTDFGDWGLYYEELEFTRQLVDGEERDIFEGQPLNHYGISVRFPLFF